MHPLFGVVRVAQVDIAEVIAAVSSVIPSPLAPKPVTLIGDGEVFAVKADAFVSSLPIEDDGACAQAQQLNPAPWSKMRRT